MENTAQFIGRFHMLLLHLPIAFLALLGVMELLTLSRKWGHVTASVRTILTLTVPAALLTAACGWLLAREGGYNEDLLFWHRWSGVATAVLTCAMLWAYTSARLALYRVMLVVAIGLVGVSGHLGGAMTHGRDYLTEYAPQWFRTLLGSENNRPSAGNGSPYAAVEVVLSEYCVGCHGEEKDKGGLRVDSLEYILAGGDSGPSVVFGDAEASLLLSRIALPLDDDDHMPPEGKPQPSEADIALVSAWILEGAAEP